MEEQIKGMDNDLDLMAEFLSSDLFTDNILHIDKFLEEDKTIDIEKLELAIILAIEYLEFSNKSQEPIHVIIGDMDKYFSIRGIKSSMIERITEESSFILGFCNAVAQENTKDIEVIVEFKRI